MNSKNAAAVDAVETPGAGRTKTSLRSGCTSFPVWVLIFLSVCLAANRLSAQDFGPTMVLNQDYFSDGHTDNSPHLVTDRRGVWINAWTRTRAGDTDPLFVRSVDRARTWSDLGFLNPSEEGGPEDMDEYRVRLANGGSDTWIAVWQRGRLAASPPPQPDFEIRYVRSTDRGLNWGPPTFLNQDAATDGDKWDRFPSIAADGQGNWVAVWTATRSGMLLEADILVARSVDDGLTWTNPVLLSADLPLGPATDTDPTLKTNGNGTWIVVWRAQVIASTGTIELLHSRSTDAGATWSPPSILLSESLTDEVGEWGGRPGLAADATGNWIVLWERDTAFTGYSVRPHFSRTTDDGLSWSLAAELAPHPDSYLGRDYIGVDSIATDGLGEWRAMWSSTRLGGGDRVPLYSVSLDAGATWSAASMALNPAVGTTGDGFAGSLAHDGMSTWVATAQINFNPDLDIFYAIATDIPVPILGFAGTVLLTALAIGVGTRIRRT